MLFHSIPQGQHATQSSTHTTSPTVIILSTPHNTKTLTTLDNKRPTQVETCRIKDQVLL